MIINDFFTNPKRSARNVTENSQRVDSLVTDALRVMQGPTVSDAVLALKRVLGDREYNGRRGFYSFYVDQILDMYGQQNLAEDANELPPGSLGSMPTTDYVKNMYSTAAERGMAAPDPAAVKNSMALNPKGDVDVSGTFNKGMKAFQNPELTKNLNALTKLVGRAETDYINHPVATGTGNETPQMHTTPLTQKPNYLDSRPATGTGKETPRLDTRPATANPNANYDNMMQPMETADAYPSPADVAGSMSNNTDDGPDIMKNWDRFGKNLKPGQEIKPLDSEEEAAVRNHINRWQTKMNNLPDPFAAPTVYKGANGEEFSVPNTGGSNSNTEYPPPSVILPAGQVNGEYSKKAGDGASGAAADPSNPNRLPAGTTWQYVINPAYRQSEPAANSVPAGNAVSSTGKTQPVRMSMTMGNGAGDNGEITGGSKGRIDQATIDRARAWAAKQNAPAAGGTTASKTTAPLWQDIAQANKIANPDRIYPGQQIKLPNGTFAVVDKGDTLSGIANRYRQGGYNAGTPASQPRKTSVKETDTGDTMDDGFKWGSATMPMQDGSTMQYHAPTNSYKQATPPTRPDLNTNISTISRDTTAAKNGQANRNYSDVTIATNPATGTGDYMHKQDVNGTPTTTFQKNVPAAELAKMQSQHFNEDINRMQNLAGIRKK